MNNPLFSPTWSYLHILGSWEIVKAGIGMHLVSNSRFVVGKVLFVFFCLPLWLLARQWKVFQVQFRLRNRLSKVLRGKLLVSWEVFPFPLNFVKKVDAESRLWSAYSIHCLDCISLCFYPFAMLQFRSACSGPSRTWGNWSPYGLWLYRIPGTWESLVLRHTGWYDKLGYINYGVFAGL